MFATLEAEAIGEDLRLECFRGTEELCRPYEFQLQFAVQGEAQVDAAAAVGTAVKLVLARDPDKPQVIHGVLASVRLMVQTSNWALFEAILVPKLWRLGMTKHSNVWTKTSLPDIITAVLESGDLTSADFELRLSGDYEQEELVVQYHESRLDFLHRWMEHLGMYYFFEQGDSLEKMIIVDDNSAHDKMVDKTIPYRPTMGHDASADECIDTFAVHYNTTVKSVHVADYDYARPQLDISANADVNENGFGNFNEHSARFFDPAVAKQFAELRAEEIRARQVVQIVSGTAIHLGAGYLFELAEHANDSHNIEYLATKVIHFCNQLAQEREHGLEGYLRPEFDDVYRAQVNALDKAVPFRPPRRSPKPRVWGYEAGVVDGADDSEYAQIDDQGRYLVKFHFDESDLDGGKASTYVRMMQPHGGTTEGLHFPLRKGTEVIFTFLGGDPDRPCIAGVVPNTLTPSPVTSANHTQNVLRTGANNHLILDDAAGAEFISMKTPHLTSGLYMGNPVAARMTSFDGDGEPTIELPPIAIHMYTGGASFFDFQGSWHIETGDLKEEIIDGTVTETFKGHHKTTVTTGGRKLIVNGLQDEEYKNSHKTKVTGTQNTEVTAKVTEQYGEQQSTVTAARKIIANGGEEHDVTGNSITKASATRYESAADILNSAKTGALYKAGSYLHIEAPNIVIDGSSSITLKSPKVEKVDPEMGMVGAINKYVYADLKGFTSIATGITAIKLEATGGKLDLHAGHIQNTGYAIKTRGPKSDNAPADNETRGIKAFLAGLTTFT